MPIGNMLASGEQQYVASKDDAQTWRILDTWHDDLKQLDAEDDIPDDSPAVTVLSEGQFIALVKEAGSLGVLANASFDNGTTEEYEYELNAANNVIEEQKIEISKLQKQISSVQSRPERSENYDLKEKAMDNILKLVSMQDLADLSKE
tara:strand:+ start:1741 stop:2184 length:444 start_codon:yes stop_codon:yes gene_type:complete